MADIEPEHDDLESRGDTRVRNLAAEFGLMLEDDYAALKGVTVRTVREDRNARRGCDFVKIGRRTFYVRAGMAELIRLNTVVTDRTA